MKKEQQYLVMGAVVSTAILLGMGVVGEQKQVTEGRYQFVPGRMINTNTYSPTSPMFQLYDGPTTGTITNTAIFLVMDSETGTVNFVGQGSETIVFPFAATKAE